jgi:hypothetical protein
MRTNKKKKAKKNSIIKAKIIIIIIEKKRQVMTPIVFSGSKLKNSFGQHVFVSSNYPINNRPSSFSPC